MISATQTASAIQSALDSCVADGSPGAIVAIHAPTLGFTFSGASGLFSRENSRLLRPEDPFRAASVSKAVTAATAVRLAAQGLWRLDGSVTPFLPLQAVEYLHRLDGLQSDDDLTFRRLLSHTSGVPDYFFDAQFQKRVQSEPNRIWRPAVPQG